MVQGDNSTLGEREIHFLRFQDNFTIISRIVAFELPKVSKERKLFKQTGLDTAITGSKR